MRRLLFTCWIVLLTLPTVAQKVGLVFSGGGAKGLAHVGVLKALEENEIPIDYIVGASMGGIIGGSYAAGMSPEEIETVVLSQQFLQWVNGRMEDGTVYYYSQDNDNPSFLKLNLTLDSTFSVLFNSSLANDLSLNFAFAEKFAQPAAIARNNFDSLFVPLRIMASDIFTQNEVVIDSGALNDALRATQTVPFFYNPIRVNGKYLFDGGVYNNFPVDVAQKEFQPDVLIGSNVSTKVYNEYPYEEDDKLISRSLLYMILDKSNPADIPASGVYIQPNLDPYSSLDFSKAKAMIDSGYTQTMRQIEEIRTKVNRRVNRQQVSEARAAFNNRRAPLIVQEIKTHGFNPHQTKYLNRFFRSGKRALTGQEIKSSYFRLVSEDYFKNIYPGFSFNEDKQTFSFELTRRPQNNFQVDFGGVIASRNISNIFLGLNYFHFNRMLSHYQANFYTGSFYKSADLKVRIDNPSRGHYYIEPFATFNVWDFLQGRDLLLSDFSPTVLDRIDRKMGASLGFPFFKNFKLALEGAYISNTDQFINDPVFVSTDTLDVSRLKGSRAGVELSTSTLNRKQYASRGKRFAFSGYWFGVHETLEPGSTSVLTEPTRTYRSWVRVKATAEQYFISGFYSSGYFAEGVFSTQPVFSSYMNTVINAPAFNPLQDSRTLLLENFRTFNYVAGGWRNVFTIRKSFDFRLEGYLFKPFEIIQETNQEAQLSQKLSVVYLAATAGFVLHSSIGPISLSVNYYDDEEAKLGVLLHVGFLLFNKTSLE